MFCADVDPKYRFGVNFVQKRSVDQYLELFTDKLTYCKNHFLSSSGYLKTDIFTENSKLIFVRSLHFLKVKK